MRKKKNNLLFLALIVVGIILIGAIVYLFVIRPSMTGNVVKSQSYDDRIFNDGIKYAFLSIMQQASSCEPVPLTVDELTVHVVAIEGCPLEELFGQV